jgi:glutamate-1-semialdehyde 2,1-aminomutase
MLPLALKRNHISAAFTETNVDDALAAAEDVLGEMVRDGTVKESERLRA